MRRLFRAVHLSLLAALLACGQNPPLTLADCVRLALQAPSSVTLARQDVQIASLGHSAARAAFLPQFQIGNGFTYNSPPAAGAPQAGSGIGSFVALNGVREYQSAANGTWELDTSGRLRASLARARADQQIAQTSVALSERDLKRAVALAYYRLSLTRELVAANQDVLHEAQNFAERTRKLFQGGEVAQADVVKATSQVAFLEQALRAAELDAKIANAELASFWTSDVNQELQLADKLSNAPPPAPATQVAAYQGRFEFRLYDAQRLGFEADYRRERALLFPQLSFNFQYGIDSNRVAIRDRGQAAFFTLNVPVFDWFHNRSLAQQFRVRAQQVDTQRSIATRTLSREYEVADMRVRLIYEQIGLTVAQVGTSEENLKLARVRYEGGEGPALDVVAAQSQLAQARTNYLTALANYANARVDLEVASGR